MTESPDIPWARPDDSHGRPPAFTTPPSAAALFFHSYLKRNNITHGVMLDVGCGQGADPVYFAKMGFEVHAMDISSSSFETIARYGVRTHSASPAEFWLFENSSFDFVMDAGWFRKEPDGSKKEFYIGELRRVLKPGGHYLVSGSVDFCGFETVEDDGKNKIMRKI